MRAIRVATRSKYNQHTDPLFASLLRLKLQQMYEIRCIELAFSSVHVRGTKEINSVCPVAPASLTLRSGNAPLLTTEPLKYSCLRTLPSYQIPKIWNDLEPNLRSAIHLSTINSHLTTNHFKNYRSFKCIASKCYACNNK